MAIEITTGGVPKTYCYYPYDVIYAHGQQVKEAWVNEAKCYPEPNGGVWGLRQTLKCRPKIEYRNMMQPIGTFRFSCAFIGTFDTSENVVYGGTSTSPSRLRSRTVNNKNIVLKSLKLIVKVKADFDETATRSNPESTIVFNRNRFTQEGQAIFDEMSAGTVYELPLYNGYRSYGTSDDAIAQSSNLPALGHNGKIFAFSAIVSIREGSDYYYALGAPIIRFDLDYDSNAVPTTSWATESDGSQYPISILLGSTSPRAFDDGRFLKSNNPLINVNSPDIEAPFQYVEKFNPAIGLLSSDNLFPLPS